MNEFKNYHPIVSFTYFLAVIVLSCLFFNPALLIISLVSGFVYSVILNGKKALKFNLLYMLPVLVLTAFINPLFNHEGTTILCYFPNGNPLTLEAVLYGVFSAVMLHSVICHFSCFNIIITSDKFIYLFGKIIPSLSLVLSMILRFVPRFKAQLKEVANAQKTLGFSVSEGSLRNRLKNSLRIISVMLGRSLESSIDTADSMKSRGYGLGKRTAYSNYSLSKRDIFALLYMGLLLSVIIFSAARGSFYFEFYPDIRTAEHIPYGAFAAYILFFTMPVIIELKEAAKWKILQSKI